MNPGHKKTLLPAIAAAGSVLAAAPAGAIELGDIEVHSRLGQPLRASIAFALAPNEQLYDFCVSLSQGRTANGMPAVRRATVSVANGVISLTGKTPVREPLLTTRVIVDCSYTAHISKEYTMFVDPPGPPLQAIAPPEPQAAPVQRVVEEARPAPAPVRSAPVVRTPIGSASEYRVQPGDTLSAIASRIENRPVGLWDAVNGIFAANPDAFMDNDMNRLKAGSLLLIPDFGATAPLTVADEAPVASPEPVAQVAVAETAAPYEPPVADPIEETATVSDAQDAAPTATEETAVEPPAIEETAAESDTAELQPGDLILNTELEAPVIESESPNQPVATIAAPQPASETRSSYSWLLWLGGAGLAIIVGLLLFGRRGRETFGSTPVGPAADHPMRRSDEPDTQSLNAYDIAKAAEEPLIDDDSPTEENLALDADLVIGTGLSEGAEVEVAEDFAFAATTSLDLELPDETSYGTEDQPETDVIPPLRIEESSILESEVLPDDDDYDMSVVIDATKVPNPDDVTERDLKAVVVNASDDDTLIEDNYTVSKDVDYKILEQDYEDELTATQKLNEEIAKAATELAQHLDEANQATPDEITSEMPLATVTELDVTAQLAARNNDISDLDDTGVNEEITVNMDGEDNTVEMTADDKTAEMPGVDDDDTIEVESGKVDTRAG